MIYLVIISLTLSAFLAFFLYKLMCDLDTRFEMEAKQGRNFRDLFESECKARIGWQSEAEYRLTELELKVADLKTRKVKKATPSKKM